eukprot:8310909-Pyramimonas_sp.AAC.1
MGNDGSSERGGGKEGGRRTAPAMMYVEVNAVALGNRSSNFPPAPLPATGNRSSNLLPAPLPCLGERPSSKIGRVRSDTKIPQIVSVRRGGEEEEEEEEEARGTAERKLREISSSVPSNVAGGGPQTRQART